MPKLKFTEEQHPYHVGEDGHLLTGGRWRHHSGVVYVVLMMTNIEPERQDEFPTTVVYQNTKNGKRYSLPLAAWQDKRVEPI